MKVFSGPPNVVFTWRHWGHLEGSFQDNQVGGILHHVASKSNLKSARAQRLPTLNGNYSNSHLEHDFPTHTEAHCHLKQSGHIQESWRHLILCLEVPINLLARQSSIWSVLIERGHLFIEVSQGHGEKVEMFGLGRCFLFSILTIPPVIVSQNRTQWGPEGSKDGDILRPRNIYQGRHLFPSLPYSVLCFIVFLTCLDFWNQFFLIILLDLNTIAVCFILCHCTNTGINSLAFISFHSFQLVNMHDAGIGLWCQIWYSCWYQMDWKLHK